MGIVARLRREKRHDLLLEAVARLRGNGENITLCVIGDGELAPVLKQRAHELGIAASVVLAGERLDARRFAKAFDVGVLCSDWEGLPVASLELMAAGTPLVATSVGALPEVLGGGAGVLVGPGDAASLAEAISALLADPSARFAVGERAQARVAKCYSFPGMVRAFERLYEEILQPAAPVTD